MAQHVRMRLEPELRFDPGPLDHAGEPGRAERRAALRGEHGLGEVFAGAQVAIGGPSGSDCSVYGGWGDQSEVPLDYARDYIGMLPARRKSTLRNFGQRNPFIRFSLNTKKTIPRRRNGQRRFARRSENLSFVLCLRLAQPEM
jgi:hypothetical protein